MNQECSVSYAHSEEGRLKQCLRDLTAFTSLPLLYRDKTPREIADSLAAVLQSTLRSDFVFVRIRGPFAEGPIDAMRAARRYPRVDVLETSRRVAPWLELEREGPVIAGPNPLGPGELQFARRPLGFLSEYGVLLVGGSRAVGFPTTTDWLLMDVASNQVAPLLETIALQIRERDLQAKKDQLYQENIALREEIANTSMFEEIVGVSPTLQAVLSRVSKVALTDSTVLITGETGTGKELIARAIHKRSRRSSRAFVNMNCAAIPRDLIASELFGHEKGAFTGALQRRSGRFEIAKGGTIFLDEVGDLPAETQMALLRVLQEREFERVGGVQTIQADVRVIAATNRDLKAAIADGTFRQDLFYRLNVFPIDVPPLRERKDDISMLLEYFVRRYASRAGKNIRAIDRDTLELFQSYDWPGNIRELQNVIERSVIVGSDDVFSVDESWLTKESSQPLPRVEASHAFKGGPPGEREIIEAALAETRGRVSGPSGAAARLGVRPSTLASRIKALGIIKSQFKYR